MSFKQIDSTNDALSVKKTRPSYVRSASNMRRDSKVEILSPPREESVGEDRDGHATMPSTPLRSSLKSSGGSRHLESPRSKDTGNNENVVPANNSAMLTTKSSPNRVSSRHSPNRTIEPPSIKSAPKLSSPTEICRGDVKEDVRIESPLSRATSRDWKTSGAPKNMTQVDGSPERPQPSCDLDPMVAYQVGPSFKVLKAPSTMRSQPKMSHVDPEAVPTKLRSSVWRTSSRGSATSGHECDNEQVDNQHFDIRRDNIVPDQIDGAGDFGPSSISCRLSLRDLKEDMVKRREAASLLPVAKSRPHGLDLQSKPIQTTSPSFRGAFAKPSLTNQAEMTPSVSKVRGLAAMFDTVAKTSPFVPTPGGVMQKKRRETARVVSPYTSNPSPRASLQTVTSVSTPVSLMSPSKNSISLLCAADSIGKRPSGPLTNTPKPPLKDCSDKTDETDKQLRPPHSRQNKSRRFGASSSFPSGIPTPSRLSGNKRDSGGESALLPQLDGSTKALKSPLRFTPQHEIRPTGYSPSAIPHITNDGSLKCLPRLPQYSMESFYSDDDVAEQEKNLLSPSPSPSRSRNPSSLRDRIRSLRSELSAKNEDCAQLRLEFEEFRKTKEVSEILLKEDLDRARAEVMKWRRRAEMAERKIEKVERLAARIEDERQFGRGCEQAQDYSFLSGSDHLDIAEHSLQPLTARMNQSVRRTPQADDNCVDLSSSIGGALSDCSENTILRNITGTSRSGGSVANGSRLSSAVDELLDFASPGLANEPL